MTEHALQIDPRPRITIGTDGWQVQGSKCVACGYMSALQVEMWCPECKGTIKSENFGPIGTVWSSTVFRTRLPGRMPPWTLAYVDLENGPRVLAHVANADQRLSANSKVQLVGKSATGDVIVTPFLETEDVE